MPTCEADPDHEAAFGASVSRGVGLRAGRPRPVPPPSVEECAVEGDEGEPLRFLRGLIVGLFLSGLIWAGLFALILA